MSGRLGILSQRHFLLRLVVDGMAAPVFALGDEGARSLQGRLPTVIEAGPRNSGRGNRDHVWHDVELFELQLKLRQAGVVSSWLYEPEIRADNELTNFGYAKDYDAIVTFRCGQKSGKVALEYERSPKSTKQYKRIAEILNRETKITSVLYLVCNVQMESFLLNGLRGTRPPSVRLSGPPIRGTSHRSNAGRRCAASATSARGLPVLNPRQEAPLTAPLVCPLLFL